MVAPPPVPASPPPQRSRLPTWVIVLIVAVPLLVGGLGVFAALAVYGVRKYIGEAKRADAREALATFAQGMLACAARSDASGKPQGLPASSPAVPADPAEVAGKKYQSSAAEWRDPSFACAGFSRSLPQYYQYQWLRNDPLHGAVIASGDLDGDGNADSTFGIEIRCTDAGQCAAGALGER